MSTSLADFLGPEFGGAQAVPQAPAPTVAPQAPPPINPFYAGLAHLETRGGAKSIKGPKGEDSNNLYNIKDFSGGGYKAHDKVEGSNDRYATYADHAASSAALTSLLDRKYPGATSAKTPEDFADALVKGGYATDKNYKTKLVGAINHVQGVQSLMELVQGTNQTTTAVEQPARATPENTMVFPDFLATEAGKREIAKKWGFDYDLINKAKNYTWDDLHRINAAGDGTTNSLGDKISKVLGTSALNQGINEQWGKLGQMTGLDKLWRTPEDQEAARFAAALQSSNFSKRNPAGASVGPQDQPYQAPSSRKAGHTVVNITAPVAAGAAAVPVIGATGVGSGVGSLLAWGARLTRAHPLVSSIAGSATGYTAAKSGAIKQVKDVGKSILDAASQ